MIRQTIIVLMGDQIQIMLSNPVIEGFLDN